MLQATVEEKSGSHLLATHSQSSKSWCWDLYLSISIEGDYKYVAWSCKWSNRSTFVKIRFWLNKINKYLEISLFRYGNMFKNSQGLCLGQH